MRFLKRPIGVAVAFLAFVLLAQLTKFNEAAIQIGSTFIFLVLAIAIHELGHVVFAKLVGYKFHYVTFGPFTVEPKGVLWNENWLAFGGITSCTPQTTDVKELSRKHRWYVLGGPVFSYLGMFIGYLFAFLLDEPLLNIFALLNLALLLVTAIPYKSPTRSDGHIFLVLSKGGAKAEQLVSSVLLQKLLMSTAHPKEWPRELIDKATEIEPAAEETLNSYVIFYYMLLTYNYELASQAIEPYKKLTMNGANTQFIAHIQQIDQLLNDTATIEQLRALHETMTPIEAISFKRSEAIIAAYEGHIDLARRKLNEVQHAIDNGKVHYGFYEAEQQLQNIVKHKVEAYAKTVKMPVSEEPVHV